MSEQADELCVKCGAPRAKGFVGMVTSMCLDCARVKLEADTANIHSEKASHAGEPLANPQSEAEEAAGSERAPSVEEGELLSRSRKRRIQPSTAKGADGKKMTPACANCKKSKIRCTHRQVIEDDDSNVPSRKRKRKAEAHVGVRDDADNGSGPSASVGAEDQAPPPAKRPLRIRLKGKNEEVLTESAPRPAGSEAGVSVAKRQAPGGLRKRKFVEVEEEASSGATESKPAAAVSVEGTGSVEASNPPRKRTQRGRKPKAERDVEAVEQTAVRNTTPAPVVAPAAARSPATAPGSRSLPSFPMNNLEGAAHLSVHAVLSRELQQKLEEAETKWLAAIQSLQAAKQALDNWVEVWNRGL
ncbi:hypothetical protein CNMCM8980_004401 [Aspergillus fumigatiaffinis]|uniref:Uncharacterized protein n=1 Tax=Aspergillus fumigatiaffinis TaxID=340414 RepID=A0A8H4GXH0_9EURO|nr:hypothetical protein CNMCM5878_001730 [Aspergillus fumigatiaffinis]KAF4230723.1 hypothetical protein CNMCM6457_005804 [Aspergillus fumigatiaffinis]KAF4238471.1 hypothetical protein CNMCM6805_006319 [Aspergillus fumigatiaffinis]KAF4249135.1 hypothetical protein CNMCM8980_004401 [Aspergillus fumigatiaffinis]